MVANTHMLVVLIMIMCFRLETGVPARVKPFGIEVRNVKCVRCGNYGHQSGDRECPLKDVIMPNEESRLKRDDPLTAILAHTDTSEVGAILCWYYGSEINGVLQLTFLHKKFNSNLCWIPCIVNGIGR